MLCGIYPQVYTYSVFTLCVILFRKRYTYKKHRKHTKIRREASVNIKNDIGSSAFAELPISIVLIVVAHVTVYGVMMKKTVLSVRMFCVAIVYMYSASAMAVEHFISKHVPEAQLVGEGRYNYLMWNVYDAALYAPNGLWYANQPYALSLSYRMDLEGKDISERSIKEMRDIGCNDEAKLKTWQQQMDAIFPNVDETITLTGIRAANGSTLFYRNSAYIESIDDPEFAPCFFGIWLHENTNDTEFRNRLLGSAN